MKTYEKFLEEVQTSKSLKSFTPTQLQCHYLGHQELIRLFEIFIRFCDHHRLNYFCSGGTLLGAVRGRGFIPHDADIDLVLIGEEYDFFYQNFPQYGNNFFLQNQSTDKNVNCLYGHLPRAKDCGESTTTGKIGIINRIVSTKYIYDPWYAHVKGGGAYGKPYHCGVRVDVLKWRDADDEGLYKPVWEVREWNNWKKKKFRFKKEYLFPLKKVSFENLSVNIPNRSDVWLNASWGKNYMKPIDGYPHETGKTGKISKIDKNNLPKMYEDHYKHLYV